MGWWSIEDERARMAKPISNSCSAKGNVLCTVTETHCLHLPLRNNLSFSCMEHRSSWQPLAVHVFRAFCSFWLKATLFWGSHQSMTEYRRVLQSGCFNPVYNSSTRQSLLWSSPWVGQNFVRFVLWSRFSQLKPASFLFYLSQVLPPNLTSCAPNCLSYCFLEDPTGILWLPLPNSGKLPLLRQNSQTLPKSPGNRLGNNYYVYEKVEANISNVCQDIK